MRKKKAVIALTDYETGIEDFLDLRLIMRHQPSSVAASRKDLTLLASWCRTTGVNTISGATLIDFIRYLRQTRNNGSGAINRKQSSIRMYLKHLALRQVEGAAQFPARYLPRARDAYKGPIQTLEFKEVVRLLSAVDTTTVLGIRDHLLYSLLYCIGLRVGEAAAINLKDIDLRKSLLLVHGKGRRDRTIPLTKPVKQKILDYLVCRKSFLNARTDPALFLSKKGGRISIRTIEDNFNLLVKTAGPFSISRVVPHTLRHAFASHAVDGEADLLVLKSILGHASIHTTELYVHPSLETLRKAVNNHVASEILSELNTRRTGVMRMQRRKTGTG